MELGQNFDLAPPAVQRMCNSYWSESGFSEDDVLDQGGPRWMAVPPSGANPGVQDVCFPQYTRSDWAVILAGQLRCPDIGTYWPNIPFSYAVADNSGHCVGTLTFASGRPGTDPQGLYNGPYML